MWGKHGIITSGLVGAALCGCASTESLRAKAPDVILTSVRSAQEVATCINNTWKKSGTFSWSQPDVEMELHEGMFSIQLMRPAQGIYSQTVVVMADVSAENSGSKTQYYDGPLGWEASGKFKEAVHDCQQAAEATPRQ